jgi:hypothetical protein
MCYLVHCIATTFAMLSFALLLFTKHTELLSVVNVLEEVWLLLLRPTQLLRLDCLLAHSYW